MDTQLRRRIVGSWNALAMLTLLALGCGGEQRLIVRIRTDFVAVREVTEVRVRVLDAADATVATVVHEVDAAGDLLDGTTVAELTLPDPTVRLRVSLWGETGLVAERRAVVTTRGSSQVVTLVFTRDCRGVSCEAATGACLNARCVEPGCSEENVGACEGARCTTSADCASTDTECSTVECRDGSCLEVPDSARCTSPRVCVPERGCVPPEDACPPLEVVQHGAGESRVLADLSWPAAEHVLETGLEIHATFRVAACSIVRVPPGGRISVGDGGSLRLEGRPGQPVTLTGMRGREGPGQWDRVSLDDRSSSESLFEYAVIESAGSEGPAIRVCSGCSFSMTGSRVERAAGVGMSIEEDARIRQFADNTFTSNGDVGLELTADLVGRVGVGVYGPNARDGIRVLNANVDHDVTFSPRGAPYLMNGVTSFYTSSGLARLVVEAGTTLLMESGAAINAGSNGAIALAGTAEAPVTVRSARPVPSPGDFVGFDLQGDSIGAENSFEHAVIEDGGDGRAVVLVRSGTSWRASNSTFRRSAGVAIDLQGELDGFDDCTVIDNEGVGISLPAAQVGQLHGGVFAPNDIEGIFVADSYVEADATWEAHDAPYVLGAPLVVRGPSAGGSALLTIAAGAVVRMPSGGGIDIGERGALALEGTATAPVRLTTPNPVGAPGDWAGVWFQTDSVGPQNVLRNAILEFGNRYGTGTLRMSSSTRVALDNVMFRESANACDVGADTSAMIDATASPYVACP